MSSQNKNRVFVVGVGMTKFIKPGNPSNPDYHILAKQAIQRALRDANVPYNKIQSACVGFVYGDSCCGQKAVYEAGMSGIPIYNVNNNCATGSTAIYMAIQFIQGGNQDCILALGFEKMEKGSLAMKYNDRANPLADFLGKTSEWTDFTEAPFAAQIFGNAGREHMKLFGSKPEHFGKIAYKNHLHSVNNPYSQFRDRYTLEQIMKSPKIHEPLTKLQCCPTSDGSAAAIICSEKFVIENNLQDQAVEILASALTTDKNNTFDDKSFRKLAGYDMSKRAAEKVYTEAKVCPRSIGVVELHDCFSANELVTYEALGLCDEGKAGEFIDKGDNTYGGRVVVNPSGGLISKGHPLGATGLAQLTELCWQLRGMADKRQVHNLQYALQHNLGLGGACYVALYKKYNQNKGYTRPDQTSDPDVLESFEKASQQKPRL
ncbi:amine-terminal domain thiolase (macronuclear) [Tetrahymena thermophila SB210]|uniref:propanoyl-CoA C-acyltransferase n=1 Tax=Tetrahymena thermophila (strain SB210) TaxID=312017 RepID=Q23K48_TETTS|nr:amine-terminal domain thiolase [Tetrahymena thermophila SB210]EAR96995.1 amine-terminal domain thiolase [Tetrahymena thermophila SB210]|eukprot:XP_001017240.1 amine-terminal domain thiolase [Tetrahymena thermophila SB210]